MVNSEITFNDLPKVIAELRDEVIGMKVALLDLQKGQTQHKMEKLRRTMNVEEAADYLRMPARMPCLLPLMKRTRQSSVRTDGSRTSLRGMINQIVEPLTFYDYEIT